ncbi:signal peptidase I [Mesobacillus foraminis]|uniref:Signal peptidase I n=1 Tax=Mesobacillus foraminis TaxID=279826 RepID=A0A4R2BJA9_9BACI|nr:signal peptidase I [Mesobacillus foraminis]TCN26159.1 signal peptidase I [Mesobacillus foraminis]
MAKGKNEFWEWTKAFLIAIGLAFVIRTFLLAPIVVEGSSMMPTLQDHDRMVVTKVGEPKRFDIVVFHANSKDDYIKRVIGLPGDEIEYKNDTLYVNGKAYGEAYLDQYKKEYSSQYEGALTPDFTTVVPDGTFFVMGDNRRNSTDSRHIGPVPIEQVVGTTKLVYWPFNEIKIVDK